MTNDPSPEEIYAQARELRLARPAEEKAINCEPSLPVQFAGSVISLHAAALKSWSNCWGRPWNRGLGHSREFIGDAMLAAEWFTGESDGCLPFERCCELLGIDQAMFWDRLQKSLKPAAMLWLNVMRGIELAQLELAGEQLETDEPWSIPLAEPLNSHRRLRSSRATLHWDRSYVV